MTAQCHREVFKYKRESASRKFFENDADFAYGEHEFLEFGTESEPKAYSCVDITSERI